MRRESIGQIGRGDGLVVGLYGPNHQIYPVNVEGPQRNFDMGANSLVET